MNKPYPFCRYEMCIRDSTTIIDHEGTYYRFTKNEAKSSSTMQECTSLSGDWKDVASYNLGSMTGYEGPTIYKLNGKNEWCLLCLLYTSISP